MGSEIGEAVILAGGLGTRLNPLTDFRPKPLVPVANYPMLDWNFVLLALNGIKRSIVVVNYLGDLIREHIKKISSKLVPDMEIIVPEVDSRDTADALRAVTDYVQENNFFVTMADIITDINLKEMALYHKKKEGIATISLKIIYDCPQQFGVTFIDNRHKILKFLEKPTLDEVYLSKMIINRTQHYYLNRNLINSGIYCFKKDILDILHKPGLMDFGKNVFPYLLQKRMPVYGFVNESYWQDCGRPEQLIMTNKAVLKKLIPFLPSFVKKSNLQAIGENVQIKTGTDLLETSINNNSKIGKNCTIRGTAIWENVKIGNNVIINNSIISNNAVIGNNCIIKNGAVIKPGEIIPDNSIIGN